MKLPYFQWPFQEPIDWRYLPIIFGIFFRAQFQGISPAMAMQNGTCTSIFLDQEIPTDSLMNGIFPLRKMEWNMGYTYMDSTPQILSGKHIQVDMTNGKAIKSYATTGFKYHIYIYIWIWPSHNLVCRKLRHPCIQWPIDALHWNCKFLKPYMPHVRTKPNFDEYPKSSFGLVFGNQTENNLEFKLAKFMRLFVK